MGLRDFVLRWCWNNTCEHNAPFWPVRGNADKEGNRVLRWECQECRKERNENVHISWLDRQEKRLRKLERSGSNDQENSQAQQATGFQRKRLKEETAARSKLDPFLTTILLIRGANKIEQKERKEKEKAHTSWLDRVGNRFIDSRQSGSYNRESPQAQQATRVQHKSLGAERVAKPSLDPISTRTRQIRRAKTFEPNEREGTEGLQAQQATRVQHKSLGAERVAKSSLDPISTRTRQIRRAKTFEPNEREGTEGLQAQQATRFEHERLGAETATRFSFDSISTSALFQTENIEQKRIAEDNEGRKAKELAGKERCRQAREKDWALDERLAISINGKGKVGRVRSRRGKVHTIPEELEKLEQEGQIVQRRRKMC
ncbi:response regulator [Sticta canariensis]|nr:response regulator [Sticta canariensis]